MAKRYSAKFKFPVVMELLTGDKNSGQVAKVYGVHPNTVNTWKRTLLRQPTIHGSTGVRTGALDATLNSGVGLWYHRDGLGRGWAFPYKHYASKLML